MHPITDGIDSFCRMKKKKNGNNEVHDINAPASNNRYTYVNGNKESEKRIIFQLYPVFYLSIKLIN